MKRKIANWLRLWWDKHSVVRLATFHAQQRQHNIHIQGMVIRHKEEIDRANKKLDDFLVTQRNITPTFSRKDRRFRIQVDFTDRFVFDFLRPRDQDGIRYIAQRLCAGIERELPTINFRHVPEHDQEEYRIPPYFK